jgi:cellulose synthase/poly-beta-1,6-N-acetylglucosamine synthase-like glycosyltransferase
MLSGGLQSCAWPGRCARAEWRLPWVQDILMIMDCDHMVKPEIFLKMGACMRDERVGVCLVPQVRGFCLRSLVPRCLNADEN